MEELVFKYIEIRPGAQHSIEALRRGKDGALVLIKNDQNRWVLGRKNIYPDGVSKMIGGGLNEGESPLAAAQREAQEEVGVAVDEDKLVPLIHAEVFGRDEGKEVSFSTFVFYSQVNESMQAGDDVSELVYFSESEMSSLLNRLEHLSETDLIQPDHSATWKDWGNIWGPIHAAALERVKELGL